MTGVRRRIAFVINSLGAGGAERVLQNILRAERAEDGWASHLVLLDREREMRVMPDAVTMHRLDCRARLTPSIRQLTRTLRAIRPDVIVSFLIRANVASIAAARQLGVRCVISERMHLSTHLAGRYSGPQLLGARMVPRLAYPWADHVIAVSDGVRRDLIEHYGVAPARAVTIYNPYDLQRIAREAEAAPEIALPERFIVSVGRLVESKGFSDLICAYAQAQPEEALCILGDGPERARLEAQITGLGLTDKVKLLGYARNPFAVVSRAGLFVSASRCEGFPNAMAEAMALGVPVVATDCKSGPAELLDNAATGRVADVHEAAYGVLAPVNAPGSLAAALRMMANPAKRARFGALGRARMQEFEIGAIAARFWATFAQVAEWGAMKASAVAAGQYADTRPQAGLKQR
ncbi:MAG: glycosyltransferase [Hyphomonadaceae bacterium]